MTELLLCSEVNRVILRRLRLPSYRKWRQQNVVTSEAQATILDADGRPTGSGHLRRAIITTAIGVGQELLCELNKNPALLYRLSPRRFEQLVADLLDRDGFEVEVTPATRRWREGHSR